MEDSNSSLTHCEDTLIKKQKAFTLAEVLITLGIIGVVAAMTIPTLIAKTNGMRYRAQFKKAISTLNQAARMSQAEYGFDFAGTSARCANTNVDAATEHPEQVMTFCSLLNGTLTGATYYRAPQDMKAANGSKSYYYINKSNTLLAPANYHIYALSDSTIVGFNLSAMACSLPLGKTLTSFLTSSSVINGTPVWFRDCFGFIDVNGSSLPNTEVTCSDGEYKDTAAMLPDKPCVVKNDAKHLTDIYPVVFHDGVVEPLTNAAAYVLHSAK